ncbi:MAG: endonuclease/exonuclease/phosphatase family protein [Candidatus Roizmanbacteria bacterium]|nr:endonuclease/exonuclease/phosphatase family protein [Candidatus Roizmanbacteria bacterium]
MRTLTVLTYNILFGKAVSLLPELCSTYKPDVVCLQEFEISVDAIAEVEKQGYYLADYSHSFFKYFRLYGLATFYNKKTLKPKDGEVITLSRSFYEMILFFFPRVNKQRTVLKTTFIHLESRAELDVYNLHLTFHGTNQTRRKQLTCTMRTIEKADKERIIVAGDFNYPYHRRSLEKLIAENNLKEATSNLLYTLENRILGFFKIRLKPDYILYRGFSHIETIRDENRSSDHFPIIARFSW